MLPILAFRIQELSRGGLSAHTLVKLTETIEKLSTSSHNAPRRFRPGTRIVREWKGKVYEVTITDGGFEYEGETFKSLSPIACQPDNPQGGEFISSLTRVGDVLAALSRLSSEGFYTIVNETIDLNDGGISGVAHGEVMEFSPGETPRCVEGPNVTSVSRELGAKILKTVYGFAPDVSYPKSQRIEFSIHPFKRGIRDSHTILWEIEEIAELPELPIMRWPTKFSRMLGDKLFGLVIAHCLGFRVPRTRAITRKLGLFEFGKNTGSDTRWVRTSPSEPQPGKYSTVRRWTDPFVLMSEEDPTAKFLSSLLIQDEVTPLFSGAAVAGLSGTPIIEGVSGTGDKLMLGSTVPDQLPKQLAARVRRVYRRLKALFGEIRMEWVFDGENVWVLQLQQEPAMSSDRWIVPGDVGVSFVTFRSEDGLEALRKLIQEKQNDTGVLIEGRVGVTSHIADLLRRNRIPSKFA
jgi:hypothetical protein